MAISRITIHKILTDKVLLLSYVLLAVALFGIVEMVYERYFLVSANAFDAGLYPGNREIANAMYEAVFGPGGEVKREAPWSLYIVNYMYMIYVGSGIIFVVAIAELLDNEIIKKYAFGYLTLGISMLFAGLFTILMDLNILNIKWMFLRPQFDSGMWLMLPLYIVYIPLVIFEMYLILSHDKVWIKKVSLIVLLSALGVEFFGFYVQSKLFDMNSARHLWTTYPLLPLYFMVSSMVASLAIMSLYTSLAHKSVLVMHILEKYTLYFVMALGAYEAVSYLFIDKKWAEIIIFGDFKYYFYLYMILTVAIPFAMLFQPYLNKVFKYIAYVSIIIGSYLGKMIFVYGGNAYPMSDRFGVGFEKYALYDEFKSVIFFMPPMSELLIVIGSVGVVLFIFRFITLSVCDIENNSKD